MSVEINSHTLYVDKWLQPRDGGERGGVTTGMGREVDWATYARNYDPVKQLEYADKVAELRRNAEIAQEAVGAKLARTGLAEAGILEPVAPIETTDSHPEA